jgi:CubicO group peptidase (beta-lactamase class C family)
MIKWLKPAVDYISKWVEFQLRQHEQPGCVVAISHKGRIVLEEAFGYADMVKGLPLTPRHRFRIASHSKSFTAAGIMKLREKDKLRLDDRVGRYVNDLHLAVAQVTIAQLLSHSAGIVRDGPDSGQFVDRRPFLNAQELKAQLKAGPTIEPNTRFKYSNHGYGLLGFIIEAVTGEPYRSWIKREIVDEAGLEETIPDMPLPKGTPFAQGHSSKLPLGKRVIIPGEYSTHAIAPAGGFVSTAQDLVRYFEQLSPKAKRSVLSVASRREMVRKQWRDPYSSLERYYGFGIISGSLRGWDWFGHSGGLQGYVSQTRVLPEQELVLSVLTNANDGFAHFWLEGAIHILRAFAENGAPLRKVSGWTGRWWTLWGAIDLVPMGKKVLVASPAYFNPFMDASELEIRGRDAGRIALAGGYASHGEPVRLIRNNRNNIQEVWLGGAKLLPEAKVVREIKLRYQKRRQRRRVSLGSTEP